jgi:hypothetical protein
MATLLAGIPLIFILAFKSVKMFIPDWSNPDRGFFMFEKNWAKIFAIAGASATLLALAVHAFTPANVITSLTIGVISGLLGIAGYTDGNIGKVPSEISSLTVNVAFFLGISTLVIGALNLSTAPKFYQNIYLYTPGDPWIWIGGGLAVTFIGFLAWLRLPFLGSLIAIMFSALGLWVSIYVALRGLSVYLGNTFGNVDFWTAFLSYGLPGVLLFVLFTVAFELGAGNKMGGADSQSLYAAGWGFGAIVGPAYIAVGLIAAAALQLVLHVLARYINFGVGYYKDIPNSLIRQKLVDNKWKKENKEGEAPKTHKSLALPFLPIMNACIVITTVAVVSGSLTIY